MSEIEKDIYYLWVALLYAGRFNQLEITKSCIKELQEYQEHNHLEYQKATELFCKRNEDGYFKNNSLHSLSSNLCGDI